MCGFTGVYSPDPAPVSPRTLKEMAGAIRHRGPDDQGFCVASFAKGRIEDLTDTTANVAFAFNRLSIVDLSAAGHQPMQSDDGTSAMVFNGELYNAPELRPGLEARGHRFRGHSDTEVLLRYITEHGLDGALAQSNGMFAFAWVDARRGRLALVRDRLGIKPLYWWSDGRQVLFASEVKALLKHPAFRAELDGARLDEYLTFRYCAEDRFLLKGVRQVPPGSTLLFEGSTEPRIVRWWQVPERHPRQFRRMTEAAEEINSSVERSVQRQLLSDVPLGCQLSGGIDSSLVTVFATKHASRAGQFQGFSIVVDDPRLSEESWIDAAARQVGTPVNKFVLTVDDFISRIDQATWHLDQPLNHPNSIGILLLAQRSKPSVTVLLSGEGADEVFGGYPRFMRLKLMPWLRPLAPLAARLPGVGRRLAPFDRTVAKDEVDWFLRSSAQMHPQWLARLRPGANFEWAVQTRRAAFPTQGSLLSRCIRYELSTHLVDLLVRQDKMTMAYSIENRVPLLDHELVELAATLPERQLVAFRPGADPSFARSTKRVLKQVARRYFDDSFVFRPKQAFGMPLTAAFRSPAMRTLMEDVVLPGTKSRHTFDPESVREVWRAAETDSVAAEAMWTVAAFEIWAHRFLSPAASRAVN
jgi:asparagine synthase (glutamine-hydrolysing)